jgi:hypothetical protein
MAYWAAIKEIEQLLVGCNDLNDLVFYSKDELDLEIFLTVLDALVDPETSISDLGPFGIYLCKLFARRELVSCHFIPVSKKDDFVHATAIHV